MLRLLSALALLLVSTVAVAQTPAPKPPEAREVVVYSGRNEKLVGPVLKDFEKQTGIKVQVRYGETPGLAALILEEGKRSPADLYIAQDAGALGLLEKEGRLAKLPDDVLKQVSREDFRSQKGTWVGLSGRVRTLAYDTRKVKADELPQSVDGLTAPKWKGRIGWAPTNASFQSFVTAYRLAKGDDAAKQWLRKMKANGARAYKNNTAIIEALARGEISVGLVNHYYLHAMNKDRKEPLPVANHMFAAGDPGALVNVAGVGILEGAKNAEAARKLVEFLLSKDAQVHFQNETYEYPLSADVPPNEKLAPLPSQAGKLDLSRLEDLRGTLELLQSEGVL